MTPKNEDSPTAMEALDRGLADIKGTDHPSPTPTESGATMPAGFQQVDSDMTPAQVRAVRRNMYFFHGIVGILLLPLALVLRTGRWSMRTLICHHNGDEFGGF